MFQNAQNPEDFIRQLEDPNFQQLMREAMNNPQVVDMIINQNPQLRNMPGVRQILQSDYFRRMMTDPQAIRSDDPDAARVSNGSLWRRRSRRTGSVSSTRCDQYDRIAECWQRAQQPDPASTAEPICPAPASATEPICGAGRRCGHRCQSFCKLVLASIPFSWSKHDDTRVPKQHWITERGCQHEHTKPAAAKSIRGSPQPCNVWSTTAGCQRWNNLTSTS